MDKRHVVIAGRLAAALGVFTLRGRARTAAWAAHDALWLYPTLRRNCNWHGEVVTRFATSEREVWLTIDDGPDPRDTPGMLDLLARHGARATFFAIGRKVLRHGALCRRLLDEGHSLGNHSHTHPAALWWALPRPLVRREIDQAQAALLATTGTTPQYFRSPVGMNNLGVHPAAARLGLRVIGWSADGRDGCPATPTTIVQRIAHQLRPGAIVLLHESGGSRHRVLSLARLLEHFDSEGYRCVLPPETALH